MAYQPTNNIFLSHQTSQQSFQPWLISQTSPDEQGASGWPGLVGLIDYGPNGFLLDERIDLVDNIIGHIRLVDDVERYGIR